jgi:type IV pilus assembly protein PilC
MLFSPRISRKKLGQLCHRLSMALEAGIDVRTVWAREAERAYGVMRRHLLAISRDIDRGENLSAALSATGGYFPVVVCELVGVGEETGHLDAIFAQLAEHYEEQVALRRQFVAAISWPLAELGIAVLAIGFLIWIMGMLRGLAGNENLDIVGFGLYGERGLAIYAALVAGVVLVLAAIIYAFNRGAMWIRPIQYLVMDLPGIGGPLRTLALARLAWSMYLTMNAGMDLRRALALSLRSTHNACYIDHIPGIDAAILDGNTLQEAFRSTGGYPLEFLDALAVAEESGKVVETMSLLSRQYREQARRAIATLTMVAGWVVWAAVGGIIIYMIFHLASFYFGVLNDAVGAANQRH